MMRNSKLVLMNIMLLIALVLQGCGHKGPLYMPKKPPQPAETEQKK